MKEFKFYIVDVFAEKKYAGNQLAVVICKKALSDIEMQQIANEMHFSETTFILSEKKRDNGYDVRIFTPIVEVPFAGHPTLGTAFIIQREIIKQSIQTIVLNLKVGQIPVEINYIENNFDMLWMRQKEPNFGKTFEPEPIMELLNLNKGDLDERFPIQEVSTGLPFFIIPLKSLNSIKRAKVNQDKYSKFINDTNAKLMLLFCPETYIQENDLNVRVFTGYYSIPEDPATGSGNGCLAGYLVKYRYFERNQIDIRVEQGYEIGRKSLLFLRAQEKGEKIEVYVGGNVIMIAKGVLY